MKTNTLRVVIVTQEEPFYIPYYIDRTLSKLSDNIEVVKIYTLPPTLPDKNFIQTILYFLSFYGPIVFSYMVFLRAVYFLTNILNSVFQISNRLHSVNLVSKKYDIDLSAPDRINSDEILSELRRLQPDIIFSIACPQIFGKKIISIPTKGCLNIHSSLLPQYRGLNANFWVMAKGEKETGVTIHYINPGIDDGDIVLQRKIRIERGWTMNELYFKAMDTGSDMISECLSSLSEGSITRTENRISEGSYFSYPTAGDVREFRSRNRRFFKYY